MDNTKVILADVNSLFLDSVTRYLNKHDNIEVVAACTSGSELMAKINSLSPDVVITNLILEDMDGISILRQCAALTKRISFIICTEYCTQLSIRCTQKYGASCYLCKPIMLDTLCDIILECADDSSNGISDTFNSRKNCDAYIMDRLAYLGIPASCAGYPLIVSAVKAVHAEPSLIKSITKSLYPMLAQRYNTTPCRVERNIRSAIKTAYSRGAMHETERAPTNKQFIATISNELRRYI